MLRIILFGLWACLVTAASGYAAVSFTVAGNDGQASSEFVGGLKYETTRPISVPVIADGAVQGYVVAEFVFTADSSLLEQLSVPPDAFIIDEAFRRLFSAQGVDFRDLKSFDTAPMVAAIRTSVNERLKVDVIHDLLVNELNFVDKSSLRP